jgi:hypothetical protein
MKKTVQLAGSRFGRLGLAAALVVAGLVWMSPPASAQSPGMSLVATVDFPFVANGVTLPAGSYAVVFDGSRIQLSPRSAVGLSVFLSLAGRFDQVDKDAAPELVFDRVGTKYVLSEVRLPGADSYVTWASAITHDHRTVTAYRARR